VPRPTVHEMRVDIQAYTGSTRSFAALLQSCLKFNRHALALCRFRRNVAPEFAVLIPQAETFGRDGGQEDPPGFHVIVLPYADDIRNPPKNITHNQLGKSIRELFCTSGADIVATEQQAKLFSNIVKRLKTRTGKYNSDAHPNPGELRSRL
jgi:ATP-dependent DNA helicase 2 subunit 1